MIMPGQCLRKPSVNCRKRSVFDDGVPSSLRTWQWASVAPASNASWVDFDLFGDGDRYGWIVRLCRQRAGDGDSDNAGLCHRMASDLGFLDGNAS